MRRLRLAVLALVCVAVLLIPAHASEKFVTIKPIEFAETSEVSEEIEAECSLPTELAFSIAANATNTKKVMTVVITKDPSDSTEGRVLRMEIAHVGVKSVTVEGELTEDGEVIGTFIGSRYSGGGMFAGYKGTCSILGRCIKTLGSDIAKWLANPSMDARLGNA